MNSFRSATLLVNLAVLGILLFAGIAHARVYVYEVVTAETRFQTASRLDPTAFLKYQGGTDVIRELSIVKVYPGDDIDRVRSLHKLEERNERQLPPRRPRGSHPPAPYIWWR